MTMLLSNSEFNLKYVFFHQEDPAVEHMKESRPDSSSRQRSGSGTERPTSASRARTDSITSMEVSSHVSLSLVNRPIK